MEVGHFKWLYGRRPGSPSGPLVRALNAIAAAMELEFPMVRALGVFQF